MIRFDLTSIERRLFCDARERIAQDYSLSGAQTSPRIFVDNVLAKLDQRPRKNIMEEKFDNDTIFKAAVRALGSNSRKWSMFIKNEAAIRGLLSDYSVQKVSAHPPSLEDIAKLFGGITASSDARHILRWIEVLGCNNEFYETNVVRVLHEIMKQSELYGVRLDEGELFICLVAYLTNPPGARWDLKLPGMGFALGAEFLRNLGWNGFKPDRHIERLFSRWIKNEIDVRDRAQTLMKVAGRSTRELKIKLEYSLVGVQLTPCEYKSNFSQVDNLVWLLGAYVERKGKETDAVYILRQ